VLSLGAKAAGLGHSARALSSALANPTRRALRCASGARLSRSIAVFVKVRLPACAKNRIIVAGETAPGALVQFKEWGQRVGKTDDRATSAPLPDGTPTPRTRVGCWRARGRGTSTLPIIVDTQPHVEAKSHAVLVSLARDTDCLSEFTQSARVLRARKGFSWAKAGSLWAQVAGCMLSAGSGLGASWGRRKQRRVRAPPHLLTNGLTSTRSNNTNLGNGLRDERGGCGPASYSGMPTGFSGIAPSSIRPHIHEHARLSSGEFGGVVD